MYKKELVMILFLGVFCLASVSAGLVVEINGSVNYRLVNVSALTTSYESQGNITNGTVELSSNASGVLSYSLTYNTNPVVYLFPVANSSETSRTFYYNVSDDSNISNCTIYLSDGTSVTNSTAVNKSANNSFVKTGLVVGEYSVYVNCTDEWGNTGNSSSVNFMVDAPAAAEITPDASGSGGISYIVGESNVVSGVFPRNVDVSLRINGTTHKLKILNLTNNSVFFVLRSEPQNVSLGMGESKILKIDSSSVKITLTRIVGNVAYMNITKYAEVGNPEGVYDGETEVVVETGDDGVVDVAGVEINYKKIGIVVLVLVLIVLVVILAKKHHHVKKKRKLHAQNNLHKK